MNKVETYCQKNQVSYFVLLHSFFFPSDESRGYRDSPQKYNRWMSIPNQTRTSKTIYVVYYFTKLKY